MLTGGTGMLDVVLDEGKDVRHNVILTASCQQHQADSGGLVWVPVIFVVGFFLFCEGHHQRRDQELKSAFGVEPGHMLWRPARLACLAGLESMCPGSPPKALFSAGTK